MVIAVEVKNTMVKYLRLLPYCYCHRILYQVKYQDYCYCQEVIKINILGVRSVHLSGIKNNAQIVVDV